ncbi:MAG: sugar ABC transporter substrate-binding protein [Polyangiaceae bacterium]|nr:sugar ABC transporter substrate-binding protein [Polyangiaceae bacterium]
MKMALVFKVSRLALSAVLGFSALGCKSTPAPEASGAAAAGVKAPEAKPVLTIWWAQWAPADGLQELAAEFDPNVQVVVRQLPWPSFQDQVFQEFGKPKTAFDVVVGDSQWLGRGATKGLYLDLTSWLPKAVDLNTLHPLAKKYLSEYPTGSGKYFAAPCETDAMGFAYRKDWFADPKEKAAFQAQYHAELTAPQTWEELQRIAQFFTRPNDKRYGVALITGRGYDDVVMGFEQILYAFGGSWGDPATLQVRGKLDSAEAVRGLDFLKELLKSSPPGGTKFGFGEALEPFVNGSTAMLMNYFAFFPDLSKKMGDKVGFMVMPKQGDRRFASLGGQGFSISTKTEPKQQELAKRFIAWFLKSDTQRKWVKKPGGFTANQEILKSPEFSQASPYNAAFAASMDHLQDFWNVPSYNELIATSVQQLGEALDGKKSSKEALTALAAEHEKILSSK